MRFNTRHFICATSSLLALSFAQAPALAQDSSSAQGDPPDTAITEQEPTSAQAPGGEIMVTGSRIARPDLSSNSPITVVSADTFRQQGQVNVELVLNQLPQIGPGLTANVNNGSNGTATVDVRGIGAARTLVLVNGRRMVPATNQGVVDVNAIPVHLLERVDVVTGGASAVYGSDALAGVVNFILKRDFEGVRLDSQFRTTQRGDGEQLNLAGTLGINAADGAGNITVSASYFDRRPIFQGDREFFRVDRVSNGSATGVAGRFDNSPFNPFATGGNRAFDSAGNPRAFVNTLDVSGGDRYNFAPVNYLQTPQKRVTLNLLSHYDVNDNVEVFLEGNYTDSRVTLQLAETPATNIQVDPNSPVLTSAARALLASRPDPLAPAIFRRRLAEVGPRVNTFNFDVYQINTGIRGSLGERWKYELYYAYGRTESTSTLENDVSRSRLTAGLNGCPVGSPAGCVPVNAFGAGRITPQAVSYIRIGSSIDKFTFDRSNIVGTLSGELLDLPAGPLGVAFGAEYRRDASAFTPSEPKRTGDLTGFNAQQPISGSFDVKEIFGELNVPVLKDKPFAHYLGLEVRGRYSDYSSVGGVFTFSAGGEWAPIEGMRFRSLYAKASRAPSVFELFQAGDQNFPTVSDPCARITSTGASRPAPSADVAAICQLQGLPDPRSTIITQINSQVQAQNVGNTSLQAEKSTTFTAGVVFRPAALRNFDLSVDWFDIKVEDYISRAYGGAQSLINACFASGVRTRAAYDADPACRLVTRNLSGELFLTLPNANNSELRTSGIDVQGGYRMGMDIIGRPDDRLSLRANVTWTKQWKLNGIEYSGRSTFNFLTIPDWKANAQLSYGIGQVDLNLNWSWIGSVRDESQIVNGQEKKIGSYSLFDLGVRLKASDILEFTGGIGNLFDKDPPLILNGTGNTDVGTYGGVGRSFFIGASISF